MSRPAAIAIRIAAAAGFLIFGFGSMRWLIATAPQPSQRPAERSVPVAETFVLQRQDYQVVIPSQGILQPRTRTQLTAEVSGKVTEISDRFRAGATFQAGDVLVQMDDRDYLTARTRAEATVVRARTALQLAEAQTERAREDWKRLGQGDASPLSLKLPQLEEARADLLSAEADLAEAELRVVRCRIVAPYDGRVIRQSADVGQFVSPGTLLGEIHASDVFEVRLPLRNDQVAFLEPGAPAPVSLFGEGGRNRAWSARVERTEAEVDSRTRQLFIVATVDDPSAGDAGLASGTFVEAEIKGELLREVLVVPRSAVRGERTVLEITAENLVRLHELELLFDGDPDFLVLAPHPDLPEGSRLSRTALPFIGEGDPVLPAGEIKSGRAGRPPLAEGPRSGGAVKPSS